MDTEEMGQLILRMCISQKWKARWIEKGAQIKEGIKKYDNPIQSQRYVFLVQGNVWLSAVGMERMLHDSLTDEKHTYQMEEEE